MCIFKQMQYVPNSAIEAITRLKKLFFIEKIGPGRKPERWFSHDVAHFYSKHRLWLHEKALTGSHNLCIEHKQEKLMNILLKPRFIV